jgi:hypothetical protein
MSRALFIVWIFCVSAFSLSQAKAQSDCRQASKIYNDIFEASCMDELERALNLVQQIQRSVPRQCRLEPDGKLVEYETNLRSLIAETRERADGPPIPCRPVQTGPLSYSCWNPGTRLGEEDRKKCRGN